MFGIPLAFVVFMGLIFVAFLVGFGFAVSGLVRGQRGVRRLERQGIDPATVIPEAMHHMGQRAARADRSPEERLRELDRLRNERLITADEYDAQRAEIIKDV